MLWPTTKDTKGTKEKSVCSRIASEPCPHSRQAVSDVAVASFCLNVAGKLRTLQKRDSSCVASGPACPVESYSTGVPDVELVLLRASQRGRQAAHATQALAQGLPACEDSQAGPSAPRKDSAFLFSLFMLPSAPLRLCERTVFPFRISAFVCHLSATASTSSHH